MLPVTVSNKQGGFVAELPQHRFVVFDNGRRQEVALFSHEDTPVTVGLVIDSSGSMKAKLPEVIIAAATFKRRSNPEDETFVVAFNDTVVERGAADGQALESDLRSLVAQGRTALYGTRWMDGDGDAAEESAHRRRDGGDTPAARRSTRS